LDARSAIDLPEIYGVFFDHVCSNIAAIFSDSNNENLPSGNFLKGGSIIMICEENKHLFRIIGGIIH